MMTSPTLHDQKFIVRIIFLAIALINLWLVTPAMANTENFELNSDNGYRIETSLSYSEDREVDNSWDALKVRFYRPSGEAIASYDNIVDGKAQGDYFQFDYDLAAHQPLGEIDLGGESPGEIYLKGSMKKGFSLIEIKPTGEETIIDAGKWKLNWK